MAGPCRNTTPNRPIEDVPSERMTFRKRRIVEIVGGVRRIPRRSMTARERWLPTDVKDTTSVSAKSRRRGQAQSGCLGCIAVTPMLKRQTPADLQTGREMRTKSRDR